MFDRVFGKLINCKEYSITQLKRFTLRGENLLLLFVLSISTLSFSQEFTNSDFNQVNNIRYGLYNVCDSIWLAEPTRKSPIDAFEDLNVYKANHPDDDCMQITANGYARLDLSQKWKNRRECDTIAPPPINTKIIDTILVLGHNYGGVRSDNEGIIDDCIEKHIVSKDSTYNIPYYTFTSKLKRTREWAKTSYQILDLPFYFHKSDSVYETSDPTTVRARTFGSETHCIRHFVNGIEIKGNADFESISCNPGESTYGGGSFRHSNSFYNLDRSIDNLIRVEALDIYTGKVIGSREFFIYKLQ